MIDELANLLDTYAGAASRTRCFAHIINLVAKTAIRQFDTPKGKADAALAEAEQELRELAEGLDLEEVLTRAERKEFIDDDDDEGWVDERDDLSEEDLEDLEESVRPMRLVLTKVSDKWNVMGKENSPRYTATKTRIRTDSLYHKATPRLVGEAYNT